MTFWSWVVAILGIVAVVCALAAVGWYTGQKVKGRTLRVLTYVLGGLGLLCFAWVLETIIEAAPS